jgi:carboxyl-terminal processing protease
MKLKNLFIFLLLIAFGASIFAAGFYFGKGEKIFIDPSEKIDFSFFGEVYYLLQENFPEFDSIDNQKIVYGVIEGMISALDDPHTTFFDPERSKIFLEDVSGEFQGIGIEIGIRKNLLQVIAPLKNTPAYKAGLRAGDVILSIDKETTEDILIEEAIKKIRGPKGEPVALEVFRDGEIKEFTIIRDLIKIPSIEWEIIDNDIAYIQLYHFHENINRDFSDISREILNSPAKKIILDLRNNPGGFFNASISISSKFINPGEVVVIETNLTEREKDNLMKTSGGPPIFLDYPVVVLINEGTASASEIVAGALRDQRNVPIVGTNSYGKGSIQKLHNLSDGSMIKITEKYFLTPKGTVIDKEGIKPDIEVEITEEDIEKEVDPQLNEAIKIIKEM